MVQVYERPQRKFATPTVLVIHELPWYGGVPVKRIPLEKRTGMVHVVYSSALTIEASEMDDVYPHGAPVRYEPGCSIYLEVLRRGMSGAERRESVECPPFIGGSDRVRLIRTAVTPIVASKEPSVGNVSLVTQKHMTVVQPPRLRCYMVHFLPHIGVDPSDTRVAAQYIDTLLNRAKRELAAW